MSGTGDPRQAEGFQRGPTKCRRCGGGLTVGDGGMGMCDGCREFVTTKAVTTGWLIEQLQKLPNDIELWTKGESGFHPVERTDVAIGEVEHITWPTIANGSQMTMQLFQALVVSL